MKYRSPKDSKKNIFTRLCYEGREHGLLYLDRKESALVAAVTLEDIAAKSAQSSLGSISKDEVFRASWSRKKLFGLVIRGENIPSLADSLATFRDRTSQSVEEIVASSQHPAFDNHDIAKRLLLGQRAIELAGSIDEILSIETHAPASGFDVETEVTRLNQALGEWGKPQ